MSGNSCRVTIVQYGHPMLKGAWHYGILLYTQPERPDYATNFEIIGAEKPHHYEHKESRAVNPKDANTYMGELVVGTVPATDEAIKHFVRVIKAVPIRQGDPGWHCHHWVADVLHQLVNCGVEVTSYDRASLVEAMKNAKK